MTGERRHRLWRWIARAAAVAAAALSVCGVVMACELSAGVWRAPATDWVGMGMLVAVLPFFLGFAGLMGWLAWRLWCRWDATTARAALGVSIGLLLLWFTLGLLWRAERWLGRSGPDDNWSTAVALLDMIVGAILYRRTARAVIRSAGLEERPDVYGQPPGHAGRARAFCGALGWAVWLTASDVARSAGWGPGRSRPDWADGVAAFGPMVLGWATYKVVLWRLSPRTRPAVPVGGFEVLPVTLPDRPVG